MSSVFPGTKFRYAPVVAVRSAGDFPKRGESPGEPLYTLTEIAKKGALKAEKLPNEMRWHPGLRPWVRNKERVSYYRLSDFKDWYRALPQEAKDRLKGKA